jgi:HEAT repeat protein
MDSAAPSWSEVARALGAVLGRDDAPSRCAAAGALTRIGASDRESRDRLIGLLRDPEPDVRMHGAAALGRLRIAEATQPLLDIIAEDFDGDLRIEAAKALAHIASESSVEPLIRCLQEDGYPQLDQMVDDMDYGACWEVQSQALAALGEIGDQRAVGPVIELLGDDAHAGLQDGAYQVLARLNGRRTREFLVRQLSAGEVPAGRRAARTLAAHHDGAAGQDLLAPALRDPDSGVRLSVARALGDRGSPAAVPSLIGLLEDPHPEVRGEAAAALGRLRAPGALAPLQALLGDPEPGVRRQASRALGEIGDPAARPVFGALLESGEEDLRYEAVVALGKLTAEGFEDRLAKLLVEPQVDHATRLQAALVLGESLKRAATAREPTDEARAAGLTEALLGAAGDDDERVASAALAALEEADPRGARRPLVALLGGAFPRPAEETADPPDATGARAGSDDRAQLDEELTRMGLALPAGGDPKASTLAAILSRGGAAEAEGAAPEADTGAEPPARTPGAALRGHAARLLGALEDPGAEALAALIEAAGSDLVELRREAVRTLGRIGGAAAADTVLTALDDPETEVRLAALDALEALAAGPERDARLARLTQDPDPAIRERAVRALLTGSGSGGRAQLATILADPDLTVCRTALSVLPPELGGEDFTDLLIELAFRHGGALRKEAATALRRLGDGSASARFLAALADPERQEVHWICIDALAELHAPPEAAAE